MLSNQPQPNKFTYPLEIRGVETDVLFNTPDGWINTNVKFTRSKLYGGVIWNFTLPLKYVNQGAYLLRREFYKYGQKTRVNQRILKNNPLTFENEQFFFGKPDFSKWSDEPTGVSVNLTENNINTQIAAKGDTPYLIPLTVSTNQRNAWIASRGYDPMVDILLTPLQLQEQADLIFTTTSNFRMNAFFQLGIADYQQMAVNGSVNGPGFLFQAPPTFTNTNVCFFVAQTDTKIRISSPLDPITGLPVIGGVQTSINGIDGGNGQYEFGIYNQDGTLVKVLATSPVVTFTVEYTFEFDFSLQVNKGDRLFFYIKNLLHPNQDEGGSGHGVLMQGGSMRLTYYTETPATHCQSLRSEYIFDYLVQKMNGTDNPTVVTQSRLLGLNGLLYQACITCSNAILTPQAATIYQAGEDLQYGNLYKVFGGTVHYVNTDGIVTDFAPGQIFKAILGHPTFSTDPDQDGFVQQENNNPQILLTYNTFFKAIRGLMGAQLGAGIDPTNGGKFCMEDLRYFYRPTPSNATPNQAALDLSDQIDIKSPRLEVADDLLINGIKGGYNNPQLTSLNGGREVNAGVTYGTDIDTTSNVLDIVSPINASPYLIEEKRIQPGYNQPSSGLSGSFYLNSAASRSDNDNHFVYVRPTAEMGGYYQPLTVADGCSQWSGVAPEVYNWILSPMQNLLRGTNYLASVFDKMQGYTIYLTGADKNTSMITVDLNGRRVSEGDVVNISDLGAQIFLPYYDNLTTGMQFNAEDMLSLNPFGEVWYMYRGINWKSFISEVSVDCGSNSPQGIKVLLGAGNDLGMRVF